MRFSRHITGLAAMLVTVFYSVGVFGYDIHRSEDTHCTYIIPLCAGISCDRIHPECLCHHGDHGECEDHEDCCHDTVEVLSITGTSLNDLFQVPCFLTPAVTLMSPVLTYAQSRLSASGCVESSPPPPDLSFLCLLRV